MEWSRIENREILAQTSAKYLHAQDVTPVMFDFRTISHDK